MTLGFITSVKVGTNNFGRGERKKQDNGMGWGWGGVREVIELLE